MEVDKPYCESSDALDSEEEDDVQKRIKVKYKLVVQEQLATGGKLELDHYLEDDFVEDVKEFDILAWWKANSSKYRVLSHMARDVFTIFVSIVASESAFSTGGCVLDQFCSSLTPRIVECLICAQDWLRASLMPIDVEENLETLEAIATSGKLFLLQHVIITLLLLLLHL